MSLKEISGPTIICSHKRFTKFINWYKIHNLMKLTNHIPSANNSLKITII